MEKKELTLDEYKKVLVEIFTYFNDFCRNNDIKYSLIGGSLIGAVRHHGIIPWDDDIDVILMPKEYDKLIKLLRKNNDSRYRLMDYHDDGYYIQFAKIVDGETEVIEGENKKINGYGIYLDIFRYNYVPDGKIKRFFYLKQLSVMLKIAHGFAGLDQHSFTKNLRNKLAQKLDTYKYLEKLEKFFAKNNKKESSSVIDNNPIYGPEKEIQKVSDTREYIDIEFENINAMIFKNYDGILRTTFGDYMKLPPLEKRVTHHNVKAWKK